MPVTITPHLGFEDLLGSLLQELEGFPKGLKPHPVVIPSIPFGDHLRIKIAEKAGICMGLEFLTPSDFIHLVTASEKASPWSRDHLVWKILPLVTRFGHHLGIDPAGSSCRDLFAIAGVLADRIDQYGHFRPSLIRAWSRGESALSPDQQHEWSRHEEWQRDLFAILKGEIGIPHPSLKLAEFIGDIPARRSAAQRFPKLTVLGSGSLDPMLVEVLSMLDDQSCAIEVHVLMPTMDFLGDLKRKHLPALRDRSDPEGDIPGYSEIHPLISTMGRHAVGTFQLLGHLDENYARWPSPKPDAGSGNATLLRRLQWDIRSGTALAHPPLPLDGSISIHSCHGVRREMEVLRDEILRAFAEIPGLKPHEIHIVVPSLKDYAPLIQTVLGEELLQIRLTERAGSADDPAVGGVLALLELASQERLGASALLSLLHLESVQDHLGIKDGNDLEKARSWVKRSGLTSGPLCGDNTGRDPSIGSWDFAAHRLAAGRLLGDIADACYSANGGLVLPVSEQLGGESELLARFLDWMRSLAITMASWRTSHDPRDWAALLRASLRDLVGCGDGEDLNLMPHLLFLESLEPGFPVDAGTIHDWLDMVCGDELRKTQPSGRLSVGRFVHLQNLPCRVLVMAGMAEGAFPSRNRTPSWDLLQATPLPWDRNPRVNDRQMFLDGLLTPSDRLIITAPNRNVRSGDDEPYSACVDELLRTLRTMVTDADQMMVRHRLQPFAKEYFSAAPSLPRSFSREGAFTATSIARVEADGRRHPRPFWSGENPPIDPTAARLEISLRELTGFWKDPAKGFVKAQGILLPRDEEEDSALDRAPLTRNHLESWNLKNTILNGLSFGDEDLVPRKDRLKARLQADRLLPLGMLGDVVWKENLEAVLPIVEALRRDGVKKRAISITAPADPGGMVPAGTQIVISGEIYVTGDNTHLVGFSPGKLLTGSGNIKKARPENHIIPFVTAVFAAHDSGMHIHLPTKLYGEDCTDPRTLPSVPDGEWADIGDAQAWWETTGRLVTGFLVGSMKPLTYAPKTSECAALESRTSPFPVALAKARGKEWDPDESDHRGAGEGKTSGALLAWRDLDPFTTHEEEWRFWAEFLAARLNSWANPQTP